MEREPRGKLKDERGRERKRERHRRKEKGPRRTTSATSHVDSGFESP